MYAADLVAGDIDVGEVGHDVDIDGVGGEAVVAEVVALLTGGDGGERGRESGDGKWDEADVGHGEEAVGFIELRLEPGRELGGVGGGDVDPQTRAMRDGRWAGPVEEGRGWWGVGWGGRKGEEESEGQLHWGHQWGQGAAWMERREPRRRRHRRRHAGRVAALNATSVTEGLAPIQLRAAAGRGCLKGALSDKR